MKNTCIIVAAGTGSRMKSDIPKQFMEAEGYPLLYYTIKAWEESFVDDIILVVSEEYVESVSSFIVEKYSFKKVSRIVSGGNERYDSVYAGLCACETSDYVYIHDGVRPCITQDIIGRVREAVESYGACVAAVPVKETIKISDRDGFAVSTPDRGTLWTIQTPQAFKYSVIKKAYDALAGKDKRGITDDAMVVEAYGGVRVKLVTGDYGNIKVTTPEDMEVLKGMLKSR